MGTHAKPYASKTNESQPCPICCTKVKLRNPQCSLKELSMVDRLTPQQRTRLMQAVKGKDTKPEIAVRSLLHRLGYRFRLHRADLPGTPDIVLPSRRCAIFVNGCFWHAHGCRIGKSPKSKLEYWGPKLALNRERDRRKQRELRRAGWRVLVVWQCELKNVPSLTEKLLRFLRARDASALPS